MDATRRELIMQRWNVIQHELLPELRSDIGTLTPKLEKVINVLEWVRIEEFTESTWCGVGRPPHERGWLANAFVAKAVLGLTTTVGLMDRLTIDRALRRICGFPLCKKLPSEATFSRAFEEFAQWRLAERVHEALIKEHLGNELIGHISRDGTAIEARERPAQTQSAAVMPAPTVQSAGVQADEGAAQTSTLVAPGQPQTRVAPAKKRGRLRRGEVRAPAKESPVHRQRQQTLAQMIEDLPTACDRGTKCNAQGYKVSWNGYWSSSPWFDAINCTSTRPTVACPSLRCCLPH